MHPGIDVYPGFVDAHCHLGLDGYAVEYAEMILEIGDAIRRNSLHSMRSIRRTKHLSWQEQAA